MSHLRLPLLDILRGLALAGMIVFHGAYDLAAYWQMDIDVTAGGWWLLARATAILFLLISGMSVQISEERLAATPHSTRWKRRLRRAGIIAAAAIAVSIVTYVTDPQTFVRFGILHLLVTSRLILPLFWRLGRFNLLSGLLVVIIGLQGPWLANTSLLIPLGMIPPGFISVDYFPMFPWLGIPLLGMGMMQVSAIRRVMEVHTPRFFLFSLLQTAGQHTLTVYLLHQPILLGIFWFVMGEPKNL